MALRSSAPRTAIDVASNSPALHTNLPRNLVEVGSNSLVVDSRAFGAALVLAPQRGCRCLGPTSELKPAN